MVASPGHKLGQMIGNFLEDVFYPRLSELADELGYYCDREGSRPRVRKGKKVSWVDLNGNKHNLDYVIEINGSFTKKGKPAAFIESAWRRYTKHSRNKAGELESALVPLGKTYDTCNFLGVIVGGEFTDGALDQMRSRGINVLYIPYTKLFNAFLTKGINLDYPEDATNEDKQIIIDAWERLSDEDLNDIKEFFEESIKEDYSTFAANLESSLHRKVEKILIYPLYGEKMIFNSLEDAIFSIKEYKSEINDSLEFCRFEIYIRFTNGNRIEGSFKRINEAIEFLEIYK